MTLLEAAAWGALGVVAFESVEIRAQFAATKRWRSLDWPAHLTVAAIRIILGSLTAGLLNGAGPSLSPITAAVVGAAAPALLMQLGRLNRVEVALRTQEYQDQISAEAEQLAQLREPRSEGSAVHGVSTEAADILAARREALAGELPVVDPRDEGRAVS